MISPAPATLILVRHGQSTWNAENRFTGWQDPDLTEKGQAQARQAGALLAARGLRPTRAFTSGLLRAQNTLHEILRVLDCADVETTAHPALNERNYGALTGLNKDTARAQFGDETIRRWRRSWGGCPARRRVAQRHSRASLALLRTRSAPALDGRRGGFGSRPRQLSAGFGDVLVGHRRARNRIHHPADGAPLVYRLNGAGAVVSAPSAFTREALFAEITESGLP